MPFKKRFYKKRKFNKKRAHSALTYKQHRTPFGPYKTYNIRSDPFPSKLRIPLGYVKRGEISSSVASDIIGDEQVFRLNSIHDPDETVGIGSKTVWGFSVCNELYERYIVMGAQVKIKFTDPTTDGITVFCSLNQYNQLVSNSAEIASGFALVYNSDVMNSGGQQKTFTFNVKPWGLLGISKLEYDANKSQYSSLMNNSPVDQVKLRIACSSKSGTVTSINYEIDIVYDTILYSRIQLYPSSL